MTYKMTVKKARDLEAEAFVVTPQHATGVLLVHTIAELEAIDGGKWIEITTEDGRKHVVSPTDRPLILY